MKAGDQIVAPLRVGTDDIPCRSPAMRSVMATVKLIAQSDASVLLLGESGSGKEVIARAIHQLGGRSAGAFVPINCASLSGEILENELFGHERGAFTSADEQKRGLLEVADRGTLFLDEINEMSLHDLRTFGDMRHALAGVDSVVALAALVGDPLCAADPVETQSVNYEATKILAECARAAGIERVIFASSRSVYGSSGEAFVDEDATAMPMSIYAKTRLLSEELLLTEFLDIGPVVLRLATVFGLSRRMRFDLVVNAMTARAVTEGKISVVNGDHWRPIVHVYDAARAFVRTLNAPDALVHGRRFNVGASHLNFTIAGLAGAIARGVRGVVIVTPSQNGDQRSYRVRCDRIREVLSFEPHRSLADGVVEVARALRDGTIMDHQSAIYHNVSHAKTR
jgi:nucleoside-diphosphate-sugar epimerase